MGTLPYALRCAKSAVTLFVARIARAAILVRCFFFSSRRRHTRCGRDWSSDVCSSDLERVSDLGQSVAAPGLADIALYEGRLGDAAQLLQQGAAVALQAGRRDSAAADFEIGRASCRERV